MVLLVLHVFVMVLELVLLVLYTSLRKCDLPYAFVHFLPIVVASLFAVSPAGSAPNSFGRHMDGWNPGDHHFHNKLLITEEHF